MAGKEFHLGLIQAIITRMGNNSFLLKGWTVTLVSALAAFSADKNKRFLLLICYVPTIVFWMLDAFFIYQEQLFRDLYDAKRTLAVDSSDYSMNTDPKNSKRGWAKSVFNLTLLLFYGGLVLTIAIVMQFVPLAPPPANLGK